jgi:hypothetical protein
LPCTLDQHYRRTKCMHLILNALCLVVFTVGATAVQDTKKLVSLISGDPLVKALDEGAKWSKARAAPSCNGA